LTGEEVWNTKSEFLGKIMEVIFNIRNGQIYYAVLSFGSFLGIDEKLFPSKHPANSRIAPLET
jgi:sporulation protein YlmC with PRC-barrel domain